MPMKSFPAQSPFATGMAGKCPRCGQGRLFSGYITVRPRCDACDLDFSFADAADGPAVFLMFIIGFIVVGGALWLESYYQPPVWVHFVTWPSLTFVLTLLMLRPLKGVMIALQYVNRAEQGRLDKDGH